MPSVVICTTAFAIEAKARGRSLGMPRVPLVLVEHPVAALSPEESRARADSIYDQIVAALTDPAGSAAWRS